MSPVGIFHSSPLSEVAERVAVAPPWRTSPWRTTVKTKVLWNVLSALAILVSVFGWIAT